jgi:antitoxin HigA-1
MPAEYRRPRARRPCHDSDYRKTVSLSNIFSSQAMPKTTLQPVHPGEILLEEFLRPMGLSQNRLAVTIGVPPRRINEIVLQKRSITADTALRLAKYFGNSPQFWLGLQMDYDLDVAAEHFNFTSHHKFRARAS